MNNYWKIHLKNMDPLRIADDKAVSTDRRTHCAIFLAVRFRGYVMSEQLS